MLPSSNFDNILHIYSTPDPKDFNAMDGVVVLSGGFRSLSANHFIACHNIP